MIRPIAFICLAAALVFGAHAQEDNPIRVLFLSKSSGFEHSSIRQKDGQPSHVDKVLAEIAEEHGAVLTATKDASLINQKDLEDFDLVIFYTTGDLTKPGNDKNPPMPENGVDALLNWIENGGAFMGYHCASDTFHTPKDGEVTPYLEMLGGEFRAHGRQFPGTLKVVDPDHPTVASIPEDWTVHDEWYLFRNLNEDDLHVLALMDPGGERENQEMYNIPAYPVIWCREYGDGRVYYNAMGHREDVWDDPTFQQTFLDAAGWALGTGPAQADPNFAKVVPKISEGSDKK